MKYANLAALEHIPSELRETGQFCVWKYEQRDGKMTKVPYNRQLIGCKLLFSRSVFIGIFDRKAYPFRIAYNIGRMMLLFDDRALAVRRQRFICFANFPA